MQLHTLCSDSNSCGNNLFGNNYGHYFTKRSTNDYSPYRRSTFQTSKLIDTTLSVLPHTIDVYPDKSYITPNINNNTNNKILNERTSLSPKCDISDSDRVLLNPQRNNINNHNNNTLSPERSSNPPSPKISPPSSPNPVKTIQNNTINNLIDDQPISQELIDVAEILEGLKEKKLPLPLPDHSDSCKLNDNLNNNNNSNNNDKIFRNDHVKKNPRYIEDESMANSIVNIELGQLSSTYDVKQKKRRRKRDEIERAFRCPIVLCDKSYGSEGALKTHLKLKHKNQLEDILKWKTQRLKGQNFVFGYNGQPSQFDHSHEGSISRSSSLNELPNSPASNLFSEDNYPSEFDDDENDSCYRHHKVLVL